MRTIILIYFTRRFLAVLGGLIVFFSGGALAKNEMEWMHSESLAGSFTVYSFGESPFNRAAPFLDLEERKKFSDGSKEFNRSRLNTDALKFTVHNATSCSTCHFRNGRGLVHSVLFNESGFSIPLSLRSIYRNPAGNDQNVSERHPIVNGTETLNGVVWKTVKVVTLIDNSRVHLSIPYAIINGKEQRVDLRNAPPVHGLGLIEAIPDIAIKQYAETDQFSHLGIKGVLSIVSDGRVGRFGWKGKFATLDAQVSDAIRNELGIRDEFNYTSKRVTETVQLNKRLTNYMRLLGVPARRLVPTSHIDGASTFVKVGCAICHKPSWEIDDDTSTLGIFHNQKIYPFSDFLLHNMGDEMADFNGNEVSSIWKTAPLWGIGMQDSISNKAGYLHDGRAKSFLEAILWHGGEASIIRDKFIALSTSERDELLQFLSSL